MDNNIPPILFQTHKEPLENYVLEMIKCKLGNWKYEFYDDNDIIDFFKKNPMEEFPDIINKFHSFYNGQHKADLFRYYYLYINGGFFLDSDAMLYENIGDIVKNYDFVSVKSFHHATLFQGILGASKRNEIIKKALIHAYTTDPGILANDYHYFCKELYKIVNNDNDNNYNIKLYNEFRENHKIAKIIDDDKNTIFKHFWATKIIENDLV
jgi:mannosyltransferase OCH1-like enzyme